MKLNIPKLGLRNIKTALAVVICILLFQLFSTENPFYACISAVICMHDTVEHSFTAAKDRLLGTFLGGIIGIVFIFIISFFGNINHPNAFIVGFGIIVCIYLCTLISKPASVAICCVVFINIMVSHTGDQSYHYAIMRAVTTSVGVIVAILVNRYVNLPKKRPIN